MATPKTASQAIIPLEVIERKIFLIRGHKVMLDRDLAELYQVKPIALRQAVMRNRNRFPLDFVMQLSKQEAEALVSQNVIPSRRSFGGFFPMSLPSLGSLSICHKSFRIQNNMKEKTPDNRIVVYQAKSGALELRRDARKETIWATQAQIADLFEIERSVVTKHIRNILKDKELDANSVCANFAHTAPDGKTYQVQFYNLDLILAVGYRANSRKAIQFRAWATKTLRQYVIEGYAINRNRVAQNYAQFLKAVEEMKRLLPAGAAIDTQSVLELGNAFADTWLSLDAYDTGKLVTKGATKKRVALTAAKLGESLAEFKAMLTRKGEASEHFGRERHSGSIDGIVGNVMQSFGSKELYETAEEKAAHLLYFMVKNHPFVDGNKRSGAYAFVWFLRQANILDMSRLTPPALTALTLLVAENNPKDKGKMVRLILTLISSTGRKDKEI